MKLITIILTLLAASLLSSCDEPAPSNAPSNAQNPEPPDPVEVLKEQVATERELRQEAETKAEEEASSRGSWQMAALGLAVFTVFAFVGGTAIGSRGKRHADTES